MITYNKEKLHKTNEIYRKYKTFTSIVKSKDTIAIIATTSSSITLTLTGIELLVIPIPSGIACGLTISITKFYEIIINKNNKHQKK